ncbi:MAG: Omp28-related outer membrane protein [Saprospiraceae bacterium]
MKKFLFPLLFIAFAGQLTAQGPFKRYVMIEHFTNSNCGICASRNPAFFNTINAQSNQVHHLAVHPAVPYPQCVFYQANTTENNALAANYNIAGTPRVALNGALLPAGNPLLPLASFNAALGQSSPLHVRVLETSGMSRTVTVELSVQAPVPAGNYRLFVAVAEKTINQLTPNGESVHRNVFRQMLNTVNGQAVNLSPGQVYTFSFSYNIASNWNANEIYALAWVRNMDNKEILNSGASFDETIGVFDPPAARPLQIFPNPAKASVWLQLPVGDPIRSVQIFDLSGRMVGLHRLDRPTELLEIRLDDLATGLYLARAWGDGAVYTGKILVD